MGPLSGIRIVEIAGIGPGPFAAMMLADAGADVIRVDRLVSNAAIGAATGPLEPLNRGRRSIAVDLKTKAGAAIVLRLASQSDGLLEGFRPGVAERLGIGPDDCLRVNPKLVYGRMTGWGQDGPLAATAGHDIDYIAIAGALGPLARKGCKPIPPLNLVGDFGGGGLMLAFGMVCALLEASRSGEGQVVDAAMVDGAALLMTMFHGFRAMGMWSDEPGTNLLDGGAPFYDTYECADGKYIAVGAIESKFYAEFVELVGIDPGDLPSQMDQAGWDEARSVFQDRIAAKTRDEWAEIFEGSDACVASVLDLDEAARHPHNEARHNFVEVDGVIQPAPAPRYSRSSAEIERPPAIPGEHTDEILTDAGFTEAECDRFRVAGVIA